MAMLVKQQELPPGLGPDVPIPAKKKALSMAVSLDQQELAKLESQILKTLEQPQPKAVPKPKSHLSLVPEPKVKRFLAQEYNNDLKAWLAAFPLQGILTRSPRGSLNPEPMCSNLEASPEEQIRRMNRTYNSQRERESHTNKATPPPVWEPIQRTPGWYGQRPPTVKQLIVQELINQYKGVVSSQPEVVAEAANDAEVTRELSGYAEQRERDRYFWWLLNHSEEHGRAYTPPSYVTTDFLESFKFAPHGRSRFAGSKVVKHFREYTNMSHEELVELGRYTAWQYAAESKNYYDGSTHRYTHYWQSRSDSDRYQQWLASETGHQHRSQAQPAPVEMVDNDAPPWDMFTGVPKGKDFIQEVVEAGTKAIASIYGIETTSKCTDIIRMGDPVLLYQADWPDVRKANERSYARRSIELGDKLNTNSPYHWSKKISKVRHNIDQKIEQIEAKNRAEKVERLSQFMAETVHRLTDACSSVAGEACSADIKLTIPGKGTVTVSTSFEPVPMEEKKVLSAYQYC